MRRHTRSLGFAWLALVAGAAACTSGPTDLRPIEPKTEIRVNGNLLRFGLTSSDAELRPGMTATLRATLTNEGPETVTLQFSSTCQIVPLIRNSTGAIVAPDGGGWGCGAAMTALTLTPGESVVRAWTWDGGTTFDSAKSARLPDGVYQVTASLYSYAGQPETAPVLIRLTSP